MRQESVSMGGYSVGLGRFQKTPHYNYVHCIVILKVTHTHTQIYLHSTLTNFAVSLLPRKFLATHE